MMAMVSSRPGSQSSQIGILVYALLIYYLDIVSISAAISY